MKNFIRYNYGALIWAFFILVLLFLPAGNFPAQNVKAADKVIHVIIFAILTYLMIVGQVKQHRFSLYKYKAPTRCLLAAICFGFLTEAIQSLMPTRSADILDALANTAGAGIGFGYFMIFLRKSLHPDYNQ